eukprot:1956475-Rhodomonas_salina.1
MQAEMGRRVAFFAMETKKPTEMGSGVGVQCDCTPLRAAAQNGEVAVVDRLIAAKCSLDKTGLVRGWQSRGFPLRAVQVKSVCLCFRFSGIMRVRAYAYASRGRSWLFWVRGVESWPGVVVSSAEASGSVQVVRCCERGDNEKCPGTRGADGDGDGGGVLWGSRMVPVP